MRAAFPHRLGAWFGLAALLTTPDLSGETYDQWCLGHFSGAEIAAGLASPIRDSDHDQCVNLIEYLGGTDPRDFQSRVALARAPAPGAVTFPMAQDREDVVYEVVVSTDLLTWTEQAVFVCAGPEVTWSLNGYPFVKLGVKRRAGYRIDSDRDGLDDFFEESLVASDPNDAITHIGDVLPGDDFDNDGTDNLDESANGVQPMPGGSFSQPALLDPGLLNCALEAPAPEPAALVVHTPLQ